MMKVSIRSWVMVPAICAGFSGMNFAWADHPFQILDCVDAVTGKQFRAFGSDHIGAASLRVSWPGVGDVVLPFTDTYSDRYYFFGGSVPFFPTRRLGGFLGAGGGLVDYAFNTQTYQATNSSLEIRAFAISRQWELDPTSTHLRIKSHSDYDLRCRVNPAAFARRGFAVNASTWRPEVRAGDWAAVFVDPLALGTAGGGPTPEPVEELNGVRVRVTRFGNVGRQEKFARMNFAANGQVNFVVPEFQAGPFDGVPIYLVQVLVLRNGAAEEIARGPLEVRDAP